MNTPKCPGCGNGMARIGDDPWFCLLSCPEADAPSYPDDVVAVMRDTITAQRETIAAKDALIGTQRAHIADLQGRLERLKALRDDSPLPEGM